MKASLTLFPTLSFTANILNGLNSYCTTFQMNHTPCWAFCESIPVLGYIWAYLLRKKFLQYHSAVTLTMRNWECWQDKAKKWLDPPLFRQTHPSTSHNGTVEKILKLWHTHWNVFHIPLNTYLANCYAISFCYLDNNISTWGPHTKKNNILVFSSPSNPWQYISAFS